MARLTANTYGKGGVRLTKVVRHGARHELYEFDVEILLEGEFDRIYTDGDNKPCVPTDTMKNTVYALAKKHEFDSPEKFGEILAGHFLREFSHVSAATVSIAAGQWRRISVDGKPHEHSFLRGCGVRTATIRAARNSPTAITSGVTGLEVLKTTNSAFCDFLHDQYTTLKDAPERIFATTVEAVWEYSNLQGVDFNSAFETARTAILETFATHVSLGVQQTIYAMGENILAKIPAVKKISFTMPNQHRILANLSPFNLENKNEIFVATSEPFGLIKGTVERD